MVNEQEKIVNKLKESINQFKNETVTRVLLLGGTIEVKGEASFEKDINDKIDKLIATCKEDPEFTNALGDIFDKVQKTFNNFQKKLSTLKKEEPSLQKLATALLESMDIDMNEAKVLFDGNFFDQTSLKELDQMLSKRIDPHQLDSQKRQLYEQLALKYPGSQNMWSIGCKFLEETLNSIKDVPDALVALLKNIQEQNQLEEWE